MNWRIAARTGLSMLLEGPKYGGVLGSAHTHTPTS
jgi:hypothetical protein